jgi:hypothetical protein
MKIKLLKQIYEVTIYLYFFLNSQEIKILLNLPIPMHSIYFHQGSMRVFGNIFIVMILVIIIIILLYELAQLVNKKERKKK